MLLALLALLGCEVETAGRALEAVGARHAAPPQAACEAGEWPDERGRCVAAEAAFTAPGGTAYWVDQRHPQASDQNPGTRERPWRTIGRATAALRPGDAVIVRAGVYRESVTPRTGGMPERRITYAAYPGDEVVVTGADPAEGWAREGDAWRRTWTGPALPDYGDAPVFRRELVVVDGEVLRPAYEREDLRPGTFFAEGPPEAPATLLLRMPHDGPPRGVEVAHRTYLFRPLGEERDPACGAEGTPGWLRVVGLRFRHAANRAQWGAVCFGSEGALVEDVTVTWTNGAGVDGSGRGHTLRRVAASHNGQIGFVAECTGCLFEDTEAVGNNWKGYDPLWEAGGGKWVHTYGTTIRRHRALDNDGPGIWLDETNDGNTIEGCLVRGNTVAGIMLELRTTRTLVQHNVVLGTRWHGYSAAGILSQAASRNALVHNTIAGNEGIGLWLRLDPDRRAEDGHTLVYDNVLAGNGWTAEEEGREVAVEGASFDHARTHRFGGNAYGRHRRNDGRVSTFFFHPVPGEAAGFRSGDLAGWQRLTGERHAVLLDPDDVGADGRLSPRAPVRGAAVPLPPLDVYGAPAGRPHPHADPGADPTRVAPAARGGGRRGGTSAFR